MLFFISGENKYVTKIGYVVANQTADSFYDSCKDVQLPANNQRAIEVLCGAKAKDCTPLKFLSYMGSVTNGATPIDAKVRGKLTQLT